MPLKRTLKSMFTMTNQVLAGENSDLVIKGCTYHVQTEDWGPAKGVIISRIFKNGSVLKTYKLQYAKIDQNHLVQQRRLAISKLHNYVIEKIYAEAV